ncbi:hypothetical protein BDR04DRAFT_1108892 [Suillus decipiens]|nr:hypothetical protein BDR04DRAFT_1108892 [Suillus decipiens]
MWTPDPAHRLLYLSTFPTSPALRFVISTSIFFQLDLFEGMAMEIPWKHWGPSNSRVFLDDTHIYGMAIHGSRVFVPKMGTPDDYHKGHILELMDFSPLAMKHHQGLGRVVREPSTIDLEGELITTSLPYVEVLTKYCDLGGRGWLWFDEDKIYILNDTKENVGFSLY